MAAKSILEIEVKDDAFKEFSALFEKYKSSVAEMPAEWTAQNNEIVKAVEGISAVIAQMHKQNKTQKEAVNQKRKDAQEEKARAKAQKDTSTQVEKQKAQEEKARKRADDQEKARKRKDEQDAKKRAKEEKDQAKSWASMATNAKDFAFNVKDATFSLLKWTGITTAVSGLMGAGGLFGLDRLAQGVATDRRSSLAIGSSIGGISSFDVAFKRLGLGVGFLDQVANMKSNIASQRYFQGAGISPGEVKSKDPEQLGLELIKNARRIFANSDQSQQFADSRGLTQFFTMDQLRQMIHTSDAELAKMYRQEAKGRDEYNVDPETALKYENFVTAMDDAAKKINTTFVGALDGLIDPLTDLSHSVSDAITIFGESKEVKQAIIDFGHGLTDTAKYMTSDEFHQSVIDFAGDVKDLADAAGDLLSFFKNFKTGLKILGIIDDPDEGKKGRTLFGDMVKGASKYNSGGLFGPLAGLTIGAIKHYTDPGTDPDAPAATGVPGNVFVPLGKHYISPSAPGKAAANDTAAQVASDAYAASSVAPGAAASGASSGATAASNIIPNGSVNPDLLPKTGTLGYQQNNPINLRAWGNQPQNKGFAVFGTPEQGLSAAVQNFLAYKRVGWDTPWEMMRHLGPASDGNDPVWYSKHVADALGIGVNDKIDFSAENILKMLRTIIPVETGNGRDPYSDAQERAAIASRGLVFKGGGTPNVNLNVQVHTPAGANVITTTNSQVAQ